MRLVIIIVIGALACTGAEAESPAKFAQRAVSDGASENYFTPRLRRTWDKMLARNRGCVEFPGLGAFVSDSQDGGVGEPKLLSRKKKPVETAVVEFRRKSNRTKVTLVRADARWRIDEACTGADCYSEVLRAYYCGN